MESDIANHAIRNPELAVQDEGPKMPTSRCTALMIKAMYHNLSEIWIGDQPLLTIMYISKYAPGLTRQVEKTIVILAPHIVTLIRIVLAYAYFWTRKGKFPQKWW